MLLRKAIHKTKMIFHKTLQDLKSLLLGGYEKLPTLCPLNPLYGPKRDLSERWESDNEKVMKSKEAVMLLAEDLMNEEVASSGSFMKFEKETSPKNKHKAREKKIGNSHECKGEPFTGVANGGKHILAQKMIELEMMDVNDEDQVLDIEEVLHYYSHLTCPAYLDIVDKFFMDMYSDFFLPQSSVSVTNSSQRLGPLKS